MQKKDCSFRIYQNLKITHADPDHLFLAITQNWAMRLFVGFVMQGHIWSILCIDHIRHLVCIECVIFWYPIHTCYVWDQAVQQDFFIR